MSHSIFKLEDCLDVGITRQLTLNLPYISDIPSIFKKIYNSLTNISPDGTKDSLLTRTGTIADGACFFHSVCHSLYGSKYSKLSSKGKIQMVYKLRQDIADSLSKEKWMSIGDMETAYVPIFGLLRSNFKNVYKYIKDPGSEIKQRGLKYILQQTYFKSCLPYYRLCYEILPFEQLNDDVYDFKQNNLFNEFIKKDDTPDFDSTVHIKNYKIYNETTKRLYISNGEKWTPENGLLYEILSHGDILCRKQEKKSKEQHESFSLINCLNIHKKLIKDVFKDNLEYKASSLEQGKKEFYIEKYNELIDSIFNISIQETYEKYKKKISKPAVWVGNELIEMVSDYLKINIFIISTDSKIYKWSFGNPYYDDRKSVIIAWINQAHYESVAYTYIKGPNRIASRYFNNDDIIIQFFKYLYLNWDKIDELYPKEDQDNDLAFALALSKQQSNDDEEDDESNEDDGSIYEGEEGEEGEEDEDEDVNDY